MNTSQHHYLRIFLLNNERLHILVHPPHPLCCFSLSLFYSDHISLQLHISILPLSKSSLISCPRCSLSSLFRRTAYYHTVKRAGLCRYQGGQHRNQQDNGSKKGRYLLAVSLCGAAELSRCHGHFQNGSASFAFTWQQKQWPRYVDLG